jgi:GNAT superfamily N-acetyltransferase
VERETHTIAGREDAALLAAFHAGLYLDAFADKREELEVWERRLWGGDAPYDLTIRIAGRDLRGAHPDIHGGIVYERYRRSCCGLMTYMVIAPEHRRHGLGRQLLREAAESLYDPDGYVFGEVSDPEACKPAYREESWRRLELFMRWGARVVDARYIQPRLDDTKDRDRALRLLVFPGAAPLPSTARGDVIARFLDDFFEITEGRRPDDTEYTDMMRGFAGHLALVELREPKRNDSSSDR